MPPPTCNHTHPHPPPRPHPRPAKPQTVTHRRQQRPASTAASPAVTRRGRSLRRPATHPLLAALGHTPSILGDSIKFPDKTSPCTPTRCAWLLRESSCRPRPTRLQSRCIARPSGRYGRHHPRVSVPPANSPAARRPHPLVDPLVPSPPLLPTTSSPSNNCGSARAPMRR